METQDWEGKDLDKDLLFMGNKIYGPETCIFICRKVNSFMVESNPNSRKWPVGVCWDKYYSTFKAECSDPFTGKSVNLGSFTSPVNAHIAWLKKKLEFATMLAEEQEGFRNVRYETNYFYPATDSSHIYAKYSLVLLFLLRNN